MIRHALFVALLFCSSAAHALDIGTTPEVLEETEPRTNVRWGAIDKLGSKYDVALPHIEGANFELFGVRFSHGLNLGCQGFGEGRVMADLENEVEDMVEYVKNNAAGLVVNYLVYSVPALYSLYDHLQVIKNFQVDQQLFTCSSVRQFASNQRLERAAKSECLKDHSDTYCDDADNLKEYVDKVNSTEQQAKDSLTGKANSDALAVIDHRLAEGKARGTEGLKEDLNDLMVRVTYKDGQKTYTPPKKTVGEYLKEKSEEVLKNIEGWVALPETQWEANRYKTELEKNMAYKVMSPRVVSQLAVDRKRNPGRYATGVSILTKQIAINTLKMRVAEIRALIYGVAAQTPEEELTEEDRENLEASLKALETEIDVYQTRLDAEIGQGIREDAILSDVVTTTK